MAVDMLELRPGRRLLLLLTIIATNTLYSSSILVASALLPQLQGALLATQDEVSWTMTFNIVASAIATPASGWMAGRFGSRRSLLGCVVLFAVSTLMCGAARTLEEMVIWRVVQGAAGAPIVPIGQALLFNSFPRQQHATVMAIFGMANMVGPVMGPLIAGEISEAFGWRWGFWMLLPLTAVSFAGLLFVLPRDDPGGAKPHLDWTGFITLSVAVGGAQYVFSRGPRLDWFDSMELVWVAFAAGLGFYMYLAHTATATRPFIDYRVLKDRNFMLGSVLVFVFGMLAFTPMIILPPLLQNQIGYTDSDIGLILAWRGAGAMLGFFGSMLTQRIDPRVMMLFAAILQVICGLWILSFDLNTDLATLNHNSLMQGICIGLFWQPMTLLTFSTLPPEHRATGMALFHLLRTFGSSLFASVAVAAIVNATAANYARMTEMISPYNRALGDPGVMGGWTTETTAGLARVAREINRQAVMLGYTNAFLLYTLLAVLVVPLCLMARRPTGRQTA